MEPTPPLLRKSVSYGSLPLQPVSIEPISLLHKQEDIPSVSNSNVLIFSPILPFQITSKGETDTYAITIPSSKHTSSSTIYSYFWWRQSCSEGYQWTYILCCIPVRVVRFVRRHQIDLINYLMSIFLHVVLMIIFEIYFYFNYVIVIEKEIFTQKINAYFNDLVGYNHNKYSPFLLNLLLDETDIHALDHQLYERYVIATQQQQALLAQLFYQSCRIAATFAIVFLSLFALGILHFRQIKWKWIVLENIIMLGLLGCFEYIFFTTIILKYNPISDQEVQYLIVHRMSEYLGSNATHRNVSYFSPTPLPVSYATYPPALSLILE